MRSRHCWVENTVCNNEKCSKLEQGWLVGRPMTLTKIQFYQTIVDERSLNVLVWSKRRNRILEAIMSRGKGERSVHSWGLRLSKKEYP